MTGGRISRVRKYIGNEPFMLTYGDGLADIDLGKLLKLHKKNKKIATLTAVQNAGRFGVLDINRGDTVTSFLEKPKGESGWINGGFFMLEPEVFDFITEGDATIWERAPLENLAKRGELKAYKHDGFWRCMDTLRDKNELESIWQSGKAPWKVWR
jgi:glucose-1-phosphate cytidylyltransferase